MQRSISHLACLIFVIASVMKLNAETGMCLVVTGTAMDAVGSIRRIDLLDNTVINTSGSLGTGLHPRFSPDGNEFAYINGTTVKICNLDGAVNAQFNVAESGALSFTNLGIYIGGANQIRRYDRNGTQTWSGAPPNYAPNYGPQGNVSQNGQTAATAKVISGQIRVLIHNLTNNTTIIISDEQGCGSCPSPNGQYVTQNQGGGFDACHMYMRIRNSSGVALEQLSLTALTGYTAAMRPAWCWNNQMWSGNSNDWIILPIGQDTEASGCRQLRLNCSPWIYNRSTKQIIKLAGRTNDFWQPKDYYSGKCYGQNNVALTLSSSSLSFSADAGGSNPPAQTLTASTAYGSLSGVSASGAPAWLNVSLSATAGNSITITNNINISGLSAGNYSATITVNSSNGGSRTYAVSLTVRTVPVFTSVRITPAEGFVAPDGQIEFSARALDQYGNPMPTQPAFTWSASDNQTISQSGVFTAGGSPGGPYTISARGTIGSVEKTGSAAVRVISASEIHLKINCGSNTYDVAGWERDDGYATGGGDWTNSATVSTDGVNNAAPAQVYKSVRHGSPHTYLFPDIPNGSYVVRFHFADAYSNPRAMNYIIEGDTAIRDFDITSTAGGVNIACVKDAWVQVDDGNGMEIYCYGGNDVFEAGIEIMGAAAAPLTLTAPNGRETFRVGETMAITWTPADSNAAYLIQFSPNEGLDFYQITTSNGATGGSFEWTIPPTIGNDNVSTVSPSCLISLYNYLDINIKDVSDDVFTIDGGAVISPDEGLSGDGERGFRLLRWPSKHIVLSTVAEQSYEIRVLTLRGQILAGWQGCRPRQWLLPATALSQGILIIEMNVAGTRISRQVCIP